ncbi:MAG: nitronate monooxygenase [Dehalococcoidia bacterium]|nr:nitronate monooxygenase [Dehalococcoidia bacterium]
MKTRMTELFGIQHPIMLAGMAFVSLPRIVAAVSNAGGLGMFNSVANTPDQMKDIIKEIKSLTDKPFGINVTILFPNARENAAVAIEEKVPILNYALGKGDWLIKAVHEYGGQVIATVATERHARRAELDGADAIVVTGLEAAAHGGEPTSLVLIPLIASQVKIPIIAAGGFCDGRGLAAALALGADGISMGTRFMLTQESPVYLTVKDVGIKATAEDTFRTDKIDGLPGRYWKNKAALEQAKGKVSLTKAASSAWQIKKMLDVPFFKLFLSGLKQRGVQDLARQAVSIDSLKALQEPHETDDIVVPLGQVAGRISDIPTCQDLIEKTVAEAEWVIKILREKVTS